jgi:crotonobetainyl-CoA:carnitine CoA-transferase CaiB-like acyl-CoA transferase
MENTKLPLEGIKVIDVTQWGAAPMCAELLSMWGADVIHVERPGRGDGNRWIQGGGGSQVQQHKVNYMWDVTAMNKRSLTLDLTKEQSPDILKKLASKSDVFLSNLRPFELKKYNLEYETLSKANPKLIYASLTGYGRNGPEKDAPGWDSTAFWARSGQMHMLHQPGVPPSPSRPGQGDLPSGLFCACGIFLALLIRERTGIGQEVDVSLYHTGAWQILVDIQGALLTGKGNDPKSRDSVANPLSNYYQTSDGRWINIITPNPEPYWTPFCKAIEREDLIADSLYSSTEARVKNSVALIKIINQVMMTKTCKEWQKIFTGASIVYAVIQTPLEVAQDPQARANDFFTVFNHPTNGPTEYIAPPFRLSKTPGTYRTPSPEVGQHTEEILKEAGYSQEKIATLRKEKVV